MQLFKKVKNVAATALTVLAFSALATTGIQAQAADIETQPTKTYNYGVVEAGSEITIEGATNLKINGKNYSKGSIKKKVKTVVTKKNAGSITNRATYTEYYIDDIDYDTEDYTQQRYNNYKNIYNHNYQLSFLKTGKYTISYDVYEYGEEKRVKNTDGTYTVTPVLEKTTIKKVYKVLNTTNPIKSVKLGKTSYTYSTKKANKGAKTTYTKSIKNRYLKGKSGKLTFTMSDKKTFKFNNALVVTRDANGQLGFTVVGNKQTVTYSTGVYSNTTTYEKINQDANGDVVDATTGKEVKTTVTTSTATDKYKRTDIYYGYTNKFTGDYLSYSVTPTTVYVHRRETTATNADYGYDAVTGEKVLDEVPATIITRRYPEQVVKHDVTTGSTAYKIVEVVDQKVVLSTDKTLEDYTTYYTDNTGKVYDFSGQWRTVSKEGIAIYKSIESGYVGYASYTDDYMKAYGIYRGWDDSWYDSDENKWKYDYRYYLSTFTYEGTWVEVNSDDTASIRGYIFTTTDADGNSKTWQFKPNYDSEGKIIELENTNVIYNLGEQMYSNHFSFKSK